MKKLFYYLSVLFLLSSCAEKNQEVKNTFSPRIFGITVSDMDQSMEWYSDVLGFERDTVMRFESSGITVGMMHLGEFYIELIGFEGSISKSDLDLPKAHSNLHGFFKVGFQANDIQVLFDRLSSRGNVTMVAPLDHLPEIPGHTFPDQYFLITDPDGNYVQFFSRKPDQAKLDQAIQPFLMALSTPDLLSTLDWYKTYLGATQVGEVVGAPGNQRALLEKDGFILEIGQFSDDVGFDNLDAPEGVWRAKVHGISKLSFLVDDIQTPYQFMQTADITIDFDLRETTSMTGDRYFMIQDLIGTSLQFFELDK